MEVEPVGRFPAGTATVTTMLILTLALQCAVPPFATDMYTPAFPRVTADLATAVELNPYHERRPRDWSKGRGRHAPDFYSRGMTVSTRVRWVRNSSMKLRRKTAVASLVTSPSSVKTSGEY
jgi:hypothetical protein